MPEDLHARLQAVKDEINVSAVCSQALESAIRYQEIVNQMQGVEEKMIARLRAERAETENEWIQAGKQEVLKIVEDISYEEFALVSEAFDYASGNDWLEERWSEDLCKHSAFEWIVEFADDRDVPKINRQDFYRGIFDGLLSQWLEIKDQVMA